MSYTFSKDIDYSKEVQSGEYEVQISKLTINPIAYINREGNRVETEVLNIELTIRDDWNENPKNAVNHKIIDSAFRRPIEFDQRVIGSIINAIPREDDLINFEREEDLLAYLKGACVRIKLQYAKNQKGKIVSRIEYEPSLITTKKMDTVVAEETDTIVVADDDVPF